MAVTKWDNGTFETYDATFGGDWTGNGYGLASEVEFTRSSEQSDEGTFSGKIVLTGTTKNIQAFDPVALNIKRGKTLLQFGRIDEFIDNFSYGNEYEISLRVISGSPILASSTLAKIRLCFQSDWDETQQQETFLNVIGWTTLRCRKFIPVSASPPRVNLVMALNTAAGAGSDNIDPILGGVLYIDSLSVTLINPLEVSYVSENPSMVGASDGSIDVTVTGGGGDYSYIWSNGETTQDLTGLQSGTYTLTVFDNVNNVTKEITVILTDPLIEGTDLIVEHLNCIQFTKVNNDLQNFDNTKFRSQNNPNWITNCYFQKYVANSIVPIQFRSNFPLNIIQILDRNDEEIDTIVPTQIFQPEVGIGYWQFNVDMSDYSDIIQIVISATNENFTFTWISEPIQILSEISNRLKKFQWANNKNTKGVYFNEGFSPFFYVECDMYQLSPSGESVLLENCDNDKSVLAQKLYRRVKIETDFLPGYILEKLAWACRLNNFRINDVEYYTEEGFSDPEYGRTGRGNSEAIFFQKDTFSETNDSGLPSVQGDVVRGILPDGTVLFTAHPGQTVLINTEFTTEFDII